MTNSDFEKRISALRSAHEELIGRKNPAADSNGVWTRYTYPILTAAHTPLFWRYDLNPATNPFLLERFGINGTFNAGAIKFDGKYVLVVRVEGNDRKSFFALAESDNGIDGFRFRDHPLTIPPIDESETNLYDMRLTAHEDGWIYGIFCAERHDPSAAPGDLSSAVATAGVARTKDLVHWERLPDIKSPTQQRNVVLHPEFVNGKYALYTRPQEGFIAAGALGGGIGWALVDDMTRAEMAAIINRSFGCYAKADISKYKDVSKDKWYFEDVAMAVQMGTYNGRSNTAMAPDAPITRQEAMTVVARALELDYDSYSKTDLSAFSDRSEISNWAMPYVRAMVGADYIHGRGKVLAPLDNITRAEFAQIFHNIIGTYIVSKGTYDPYSFH